MTSFAIQFTDMQHSPKLIKVMRIAPKMAAPTDLSMLSDFQPGNLKVLKIKNLSTKLPYFY